MLHHDASPTAGLRRIRAAFAYGGAAEGAIAVALVLGTGALLSLPVDAPLLVAAFCGTAAVYALDRAAGFSREDRVNRRARSVWWETRRPLVLAYMLGVLITLPVLETRTLALAGSVAVLSGLYVLPLLPRRRRLKDLGRLKPLIIGAGWGAGAVGVPLLEAGAAFDMAAAALLAARMLTVAANALLADWPDRSGDARAGIETFAGRRSWAWMRSSALGLVAAAAVLEGVLLVTEPPALVAVDAVGLAVLAVVIVRLRPDGHGFRPWLDLAVAWPAATALCAWLA